MLVQKRSRDHSLSHEFTVVLDTDFYRFITQVEKRIEVASKISGALGDRSPRFVRITRLVAGSVTFSWTNSSLLPTHRLSGCPVQVSNTVACFHIIISVSCRCRRRKRYLIDLLKKHFHASVRNSRRRVSCFRVVHPTNRVFTRPAYVRCMVVLISDHLLT